MYNVVSPAISGTGVTVHRRLLPPVRPAAYPPDWVVTGTVGAPVFFGKESAHMPKMKTHKGAARRFKVTGTGLIMRPKGMKSHFRRRKSPRVLRALDRMTPLDSTLKRRVQKLLPYGLKKD
jgi:large subunit ribosomal protein L35